jgi:hypothetical protein
MTLFQHQMALQHQMATPKQALAPFGQAIAPSQHHSGSSIEAR